MFMSCLTTCKYNLERIHIEYRNLELWVCFLFCSGSQQEVIKFFLEISVDFYCGYCCVSNCGYLRGCCYYALQYLVQQMAVYCTLKLGQQSLVYSNSLINRNPSMSCYFVYRCSEQSSPIMFRCKKNNFRQCAWVWSKNRELYSSNANQFTRITQHTGTHSTQASMPQISAPRGAVIWLYSMLVRLCVLWAHFDQFVRSSCETPLW